MKKLYFLSLLTLAVCSILTAQDSDQKEIRAILADQIVSWNKGDLTSFMKGYWNNDSLVFVGKAGVTYGFRNTLTRYKETYSSADKMGKLFFDVLKVQKLAGDYYFVLGKWFLKRGAGDVGGHYTLLFRKIKGKWQIVCDHSS